MKYLGIFCCLLGIFNWVSTGHSQLSELTTNYIKVSFNEDISGIDGIYADFLGKRNFSFNLLAKPLQLEVAYASVNSNHHHFISSISDVSIPNEIDDPDSSYLVKLGAFLMTKDGIKIIKHIWNIELSPISRKVVITTEGEVLQTVELVSLSYGLYLPNPALYALFESGISQMMGKAHSCLGSNETLDRVYFMGGGSAMDSMFTTTFEGQSLSQEVVLVSSSTEEYKSAVQYVIFGNYPHKSKKLGLAWSKSCWTDAKSVTIPSGIKWRSNLVLIPNNYNFPAYLVANVDESFNNMPFEYLQPFLTGVYGSPVGCVQSYYENQQGIIAPTISHPDVGYDPDTNFFDPDNFISLSAMMYSGDGYLMNQVKEILERTAQTMCGIGTNEDKKYCGINRDRLKHQPLKLNRFERLAKISRDERFNASSRAGQLMHHFISLSPTYESIAGSEQLGPNIFWTWAVLRYIGISQDFEFAKKMFPFIDLSAKFMLSFVDPAKDFMINAPGPLWIDVLVRENYTSDSNAMMVPIFQEVAQIYDYLSVDSDFALQLRDISVKIQAGLNDNLWAATQDHLITQLNLDGSVRDFIDYDANLIAVAFGVIPEEKMKAVLDKVDNGSFTHVRATWCSEVPYSGDAQDCYIVGGNVCGDSVVTLARIGWVDALARKRVRDDVMVRDVLLQPLINDILQSTWLYERYDSNGNQIRTSYYFEYPSLIAIILREVIYGIDISINMVRIDPIVYHPFTYKLGNTHVSYNKDSIILNLPCTEDLKSVKEKNCSVYHMEEGSLYSVRNSCYPFKDELVAVSSDGILSFSTKFGHNCEVKITKASSV